MKKITKKNDIPKNSSLILGFFDGIHLGHQDVIQRGVDFAKENNTSSVLITFKNSPTEYFQGSFEYIFPRKHSYDLIKNLGVDYIYECNFAELANITAEDYLKHNIIETFAPMAITTGFNHTFGLNKVGNADFLANNQTRYNYKYFSIPAYKYNQEVVSSTAIKQHLSNGEIDIANKLLNSNFTLESKVIKGNQLGRKLGFPTANMEYPTNIIKIPFGVYKIRVFNKPAILNWGKKPTLKNQKEVLEVHIPDFDDNLYGKTLKIEILDKIRDEKKFKNIEELKSQIEKDVAECLK